MKWLIWTGALVFIFILQLSFSELNFPSTPNLVLVYLCVLLLFLNIKNVLWIGAIGGVLLDFFSGLPDGVILVALLGSVTGSYYIGQSVFTEKLSNLILLFYTAIASILFLLIAAFAQYLLTLGGIGHLPDISYLLTRKLGADVIFNLLFLFPVYYYYELQSKLESRYKIPNEPI